MISFYICPPPLLTPLFLIHLLIIHSFNQERTLSVALTQPQNHQKTYFYSCSHCGIFQIDLEVSIVILKIGYIFLMLNNIYVKQTWM
jgi:hypothetical protein